MGEACRMGKQEEEIGVLSHVISLSPAQLLLSYRSGLQQQWPWGKSETIRA